MTAAPSGGDLVGRVLERQGVRFLFTLCGGHISPILLGAKRRHIRVVDTRHEATAVFAADAVARLTGVPGVAAVTAGPGVTNTITAVKNAQLAQSPVVVLGGAAPTVLKGRGALQDIDQMALFAPHVKRARSLRRVRELGPALEEAFAEARSGVPGPVFVECPVDLLYPQELVRGWYSKETDRRPRNVAEAAKVWYLRRHLRRMFSGAGEGEAGEAPADGTAAGGSDEPALAAASERALAAAGAAAPRPAAADVGRALAFLQRAERPLLVIGSQALLLAGETGELVAAVERLGLPVYLAGMARGLLGRAHPLQLRHQRRAALKEADLVILAGFPCDFRLGYGAPIRRRAVLVAANRSRADLKLNRRPTLGVLGDAALFLRALAAAAPPPAGRWDAWIEGLRRRDAEREGEIAAQAAAATEHLNPVALTRAIDGALADDSMLVADGGDFVATAAYTVSPRGPLRWLDPGVFGTLGVGAGFALGAKLCRPQAEIWLLYGDGSAGYSLAEFDTFARHRLPVIAVVGNDAGWTQIAREQVPILGDAVGTTLARTAYHRAAEGFGGAGLELKDPAATEQVLADAKARAAAGAPVLVNAWLGATDFRKGSISM